MKTQEESGLQDDMAGGSLPIKSCERLNSQSPDSRAAMTVLYCVLCTYGCTMEPAHVEEHYVQQRVQILSTAVGSYGDCCTDNR